MSLADLSSLPTQYMLVVSQLLLVKLCFPLLVCLVLSCPLIVTDESIFLLIYLFIFRNLEDKPYRIQKSFEDH